MIPEILLSHCQAWNSSTLIQFLTIRTSLEENLVRSVERRTHWCSAPTAPVTQLNECLLNEIKNHAEILEFFSASKISPFKIKIHALL